MRILSKKRHLSADHSSSTYQFLAADKLTDDERSFVTGITGQAPKGRGLYIHYWGEREIPWEWHKKLLSGPYDVLVSESYDHWLAEFTVPYDAALYERLQRYECPGDTEGIEIEQIKDRVYCSLSFHVEFNADFFDYDADPVKQIAELFEDIRSDVIDGDVSALWVMYETYCSVDDEAEQTGDERQVSVTEHARLLQSFLTSIE